ncbi:MAG TPA: DUF881 domain-containing protein [Candidatus Limnocylindrales bacterium]|jgi:uncharacterized protein YlxW (UPF0749 family)
MRRIGAWLRGLPSWQVTLGVALLLLGFLIAAQLAAEGPRVRYTSEERTPLVEAAVSLQATQDGLKKRIVELRTAIQTLEGESAGSQAALRTLNDDLEEARIAAGLIPMTGTGLVLKLQDSSRPVAAGANDADYVVSAADLRTVVDQLWLAGAEAIAVNDERVATTTAIIDIGGAVLVNASYVAGPYQVSAIGPADLFARVSGQPGFQDFVVTRVGGFGLDLSRAEPPVVDIPAFAGSVTLQASRAVASPEPTATATPAASGSAP